MFRSRTPRFLFLVILGCVPVDAQSQTSGAVVSGQGIFGVVTSAVATPLERMMVCPRVLATREIRRCANPDSSGRYHLTISETTPIVLSVHCQAIRGFAKLLASDTVSVDAAKPLEKNWEVIPNGCDPRFIRRANGVFRGHYVGGFEESSFVPCKNDSWVTPSDSIRDEDTSFVAWVEFSKGTTEGIHWPKAPRNSWGSPRYYVRWRGTVIGPSSYGHMGVSPFLF